VSPDVAVLAGIGNLDGLRRMTQLKFAKSGMHIDDAGIAGKPAADDAGIAKKPAAALKRPAAALKRPAASPSIVPTTKRPAAAAAGIAAAAATLPAGWSSESRVCKGGARLYRVWTSPGGKSFHSWAGVQRIIRTMLKDKTTITGKKAITGKTMSRDKTTITGKKVIKSTKMSKGKKMIKGKTMIKGKKSTGKK
jgi:hypothetical protein